MAPIIQRGESAMTVHTRFALALLLLAAASSAGAVAAVPKPVGAGAGPVLEGEAAPDAAPASGATGGMADEAVAALQGDPRPSSGHADEAAVAEYRARLKAQIAAVKVEYDQRVARDGKAAADRWLAETAREMGRREGEAARRAQGR
jgi:hypothetical protein